MTHFIFAALFISIALACAYASVQAFWVNDVNLGLAFAIGAVGWFVATFNVVVELAK